MVTIRLAASADRTRLGELGALLVALHHGFDPQRFLAPTADTAAGYGGFLVGEAEREGAFVLVAEDADGVVGYVYAGLEDADWMTLRGPAGAVYDLVVDPGRRQAGIGRKLLQDALSRLAELGAPRVVLSTAVGNDAAQRLFAAMGFRPTMIEMTRERATDD